MESIGVGWFESLAYINFARNHPELEECSGPITGTGGIKPIRSNSLYKKFEVLIISQIMWKISDATMQC